MSDSPSKPFRWQTFFQNAGQPIFLVNRRRRILFVNRAWENCTGLASAEVRGRVCRRRSASSAAERDEVILSVCAPPADALAGRVCMARRRAPDSNNWWEIQFQPLLGEHELLGILGTIRVLAAPAEAPFGLPEKLMALRDRQAARYRLDDLSAGSPALRRLHEQARLAAQTSAPISILGEAGAGKAWLARAIHGFGEQRQRYFACLDAERLPAAAIGEMLYGPRSRKLGFGTVYLREPACLPREWQSRLADSVRLRENPDFPRLIVGYREDPAALVQAGRLLEDFHFAVSPITLALPPLRDRKDELPAFIDRILQRLREAGACKATGVGDEAMKLFSAHGWPGNLHELMQVLREGGCRAATERIELADLPFFIKHGPLPPERMLPLDTLLERVEHRLIALALKLAQNNQTRAAELLAIWRPRLVRRMEKFGIKDA